MFGFGIVLSIEHQQHAAATSRLSGACYCARRQRPRRTKICGPTAAAARTLALATAVGPELKGLGSAVVSTAVKAVYCRQSDGGVLNYAVAQQQQQCVIYAHMPHTSSTTIRKHLGEL